MKITIAKTAGFCFGVKRAVDLAFEQQNTEGTYTLGPIIHNEVVTHKLEQKGIYAIDEIKDEPVKKLIIRSHGVSPSVYEEGERKHIEIVDATCPYVKKIHRLVAKYDEMGYGILIAGNKNHPEIQGISGWAKNDCIIAKDLDDLKSQSNAFENKKYLVVAQTTYKKQIVDEMINWLDESHIEFEFINTICNATKERQEEVIEMAKQMDVMLVLGSKKSNNSIKLFELSEQYCKRSYFISEASELQKSWFMQNDQVGITAGASTPDSVITDVVTFLQQSEK